MNEIFKPFSSLIWLFSIMASLYLTGRLVLQIGNAWNYENLTLFKIENQILIIYRHFTNFFAKFCIISRKEISEKCENDTKFRAQTNFLSRIFSQNFRIYFPKNVHICYFAKFSYVLFRENFRIFRGRTKCEKLRNWIDVNGPFDEKILIVCLYLYTHIFSAPGYEISDKLTWG